MSKDTYQRIKEFFDSQKVAYREIKHAAAASAQEYQQVLKCRWEQQAKCLLLKVYSPEGDFFVNYAIQAQKRADLEQIKAIFKAKKARFANKEELMKVAQCRYGEMPAVGKILGIKLIMDKDFFKEKEILMAAGRLDISFGINPEDLKRIEEPIVV